MTPYYSLLVIVKPNGKPLQRVIQFNRYCVIYKNVTFLTLDFKRRISRVILLIFLKSLMTKQLFQKLIRCSLNDRNDSLISTVSFLETARESFKCVDIDIKNLLYFLIIKFYVSF